MNKIILILLLFSFSLMTACTNSEEAVSQLKEEKEKLTLSLNENKAVQEKLSQRVTELEQQVQHYQKEAEMFSVFSDLSRQFVQAHTSGDIDTLQTLLSDELVLEQNGHTLYIEDDTPYKWQVFTADGDKLDDWAIQGFQYNKDNNTYMVHIREFYMNADEEPVSPPTFLNLTFKLVKDEWKVSGLGFDV